MFDGPEIWEFLMWVVPLVVSVIQTVRQPIVEDIIHRSVDALCGFVSGELGRLWRFARQKKPQKIEEELKTQIKEVEAENEVLREKNGAMEKQVVDLQKIEEELKTKVKEVEAENQMLSKRNQKMQKKVVDLQKIEEQLKIEKNYIIEVAAKNEVQLKKYIDDLVAKNEVLDKKVVDLQKIEEQLKTKIEEAGAENKLLRENNKAVEKKLVQSPVPLSGQYQGTFGGQILSLTFEGKLSIIKSNIGEEGGIPLGPWGGNGGRYWAYKLDVAPILQITLGYGSIIDSILITSKSRDGNVIGCSDRFGGPGGEYTATLCIDSSEEQLSSISLTYGEFFGMRVITSLSFYSNRGKYGPYGTLFSSTVSIPVEGALLAGFHGRGGNYLDAFGVFVAPRLLNSSHKASGSGLRLEEI